MVVAGYSLGGNLALKLAGDYGAAPPPSCEAVCAVSPVIELGSLRRRARAAVEHRLPVELRPRAAGAHAPQGSLPSGTVRRSTGSPRVRTVRQFDEAYTAPYFGFAGATDYYHRASAMRVVDGIRVPALIITAEDDPFVPTEPFRDPALTANPQHHSWSSRRHGGHCAFVGPASATAMTATGRKRADREFAQPASIEPCRAQR